MYEQAFNPFSANVAVIKGYFKNPKVLALGILHLVSLCLTVLTLTTQPLTDTVRDLLSQIGGADFGAGEFYAYYSDAETSVMASMMPSIIISSAVSILTAVAFILIYVKSRSDDPNASPKTGVQILYVLAMIGFVGSIVIAVLVGLVLLLILLAGGLYAGYGDDAGMTGAVIVILLIFALILAGLLFLLIFTALSQKNYYRSVKNSLTTVQLENKGAKAYGVLNIIFAVFSGLSLFGTVIGTVSGPISPAAFLPLASEGVSLAALILNASLALGYSRYIDAYRSGYNTPGSPNMYVPAGGGQNPYAQQPYNDGYQSYNMPPQQPNNTIPTYTVPLEQPTADDSYTPSQTQPVDNGGSAPEQSRPAYCPNCGAPIDPAAPFCSNCGNKL